VHFKRSGVPNGWQYKTYWRVLLPVFVQVALAATLGSVGALLLSRKGGRESFAPGLENGQAAHVAPAADVRAAAAAAEAVVLMAAIWVAFQGYVAVALARMWQRELEGLAGYTTAEVVGILLTIAVALRARSRLGEPVPRPFVSEHWRFGQLYKNPDDPALFVPTRDGTRWTLNFGRPVTAALMAVVLLVGVVAPTVILGILLR
jgi:uncharacterized membrane protein